jgi:hypothetical protein
MSFYHHLVTILFVIKFTASRFYILRLAEILACKLGWRFLALPLSLASGCSWPDGQIDKELQNLDLYLE